MKQGTAVPTEAHMKAALQAYVDAYNRDDLEGILALFAPDAEVEDPVGTPIMRWPEFSEFYRRGVAMKARLALAAPIRGSHGNAAAMVFTVTFQAETGPVTVRSLDVATFDEDGRIKTMKGYWGPDDSGAA